MTTLLNYLKAHLTSISSWAAALLTIIGTLLASGVIGPGTTLYHVLGGIVSVLTVLGFKAIPVPSTAPATSAPASGTAT